MKNHAADPEIGFLAKSIQKSNDCATAMSTALELIRRVQTVYVRSFSSFSPIMKMFPSTNFFNETT